MDRDWDTRAGAFELRIPKLRKLNSFPGISIRSVDDLVKAMGMSGISGTTFTVRLQNTVLVAM